MPETTVQDQTAALVADDRLYEVIDGRMVEKPPKGAFQSVVAAWLVQALSVSDLVRRRGLVVSETLFALDPAGGRKRRPDVAFVSFERWAKGRPVPDLEAWDVVPDLAVEIISKSNAAVEVVDKLEEYFQAGVRLVWVIYPVRRKLYAYSSPTEVRILQPGDDLDGGPVLPGFRVPVGAIFGEHD